MFTPTTLDEINQRRREFETAAATDRAIRAARTSHALEPRPSRTREDVRRIATGSRMRRINLARTRRATTR